MALAIGVVLACTLALAWRALVAERQTVDDLFIYLRYARALATSGEIAFSPGERVEGASSVLWTLVLGASFELGLRGVGAAKLWSLALMIATPAVSALAVHRATRAATPRVRAIVTSIPALALALDADFATWGASGMDTSAFALACASCVALVAANKLRAAAFALGMLAWVRPEGPLLGVLGVVALVAAKRASSTESADSRAYAPVSRRDAIVLLAIAAAPVVVLTTLRAIYFHDLVPNTFYAKMRSVDGRDYTGGAYVVSELARRPILLIGGALAGVWAVRARHAAALVATALTLGVIVFVLVAQGDWMPNRRLLVPLLPLAAIAIAIALAHVLHALVHAQARARGAAFALAAASLLFVEGAVTTDHALDQKWRTTEWLDKRVERWRWAPHPLRDPYPLDWMPTHLVHVAAPYVAPGDTLAHVDVGELPYVMHDVRIVDGFGLVDREAGRLAFFGGGSDASRVDAAREAFFAKDPVVVIVVLDERTGRAFSPAQDAAMRDARFVERYREIDRVPSWGDHPCVTFAKKDRAPASIEEANRRIDAWLASVPDVTPAF